MKPETKSDLKVGLGIAFLFVFFNYWYYYTGDGSDIIQPVDAYLFLGIAAVAGFCYLVEWIWNRPLKYKGGNLTHKQLDELERKKFIEDENKIW